MTSSKTVLPPRRTHAIIVDVYLPLVFLTKDMELFREAFAGIICSHAILCLHGIEHCDISVANLKCTEDGRPKLCDYDLSHLREGERAVGFTNTRTGNLRFMALELLSSYAVKGKVRRVYRHEVEAFSWVLLWILGRYRNGKKLEPEEGRLFDLWANSVSFSGINAHRDTAFESIAMREVDFPQPLSDDFRLDALRFIVFLRKAQRNYHTALESLAIQEDPHLEQKFREELAILSSPTFVQSVLNTTLVAKSEYSGLVKVALEAYMTDEINGTCRCR